MNVGKCHNCKFVEHAEARSACSTNPYVVGSRPNGRRTYQFMSSEVVSWKEFQKVNPDDRCAHCVDAGLVIRNRQRKAKGLPQLKSLFQDCSEARI